MFNPGETVGHKFIIPFVASNIAEVIVTYKQDGDVVLEKTITSGFDALEPVKTSFVVTFSQEESLMFRENRKFTVQINVLSLTGSRATSKEMEGKNGAQYYKEVMTDERIQL